MVLGLFPLISISAFITSFSDCLVDLSSSKPGVSRLFTAGIFPSDTYAADQEPVDVYQSCSNPQLSCPAKLPSSINTCCLNHPSGHFLLTQFWDTSPSLGAKDAWTIHGLWPDLCTGGFDQFCSHERSYQNITAILKSTKAGSDSNNHLLDFMNNHWLSINGDNEHLWAHEWNKHGTCISTIEPNCYGPDTSKFVSVLDYFTHATNLYSTLDTYSLLGEAGITPSLTQTYTLAELEIAIAQRHNGHPVTFRCNYRHELDEIWYHYTVRGPLRGAVPSLSVLPQLPANKAKDMHHPTTEDLFVPADPDGSKTNCPARGIKYLPKSSNNAPSTTLTKTTRISSSQSRTSTSEPTNTGRPFTGKGHLLILPKRSPSTLVTRSETPLRDHNLSPKHDENNDDNDQQDLLEVETKGCLIRSGEWYTSGSCATYLAKEDANHVLSNTNESVTGRFYSADGGDDDNEKRLFTLSSLYAPCAILPDTQEFRCGKDLGVQSIFEALNPVEDGDGEDSDADVYGERQSGGTKVLGYRGSTRFYAEKTPGRFEKVLIYAGAVGKSQDDMASGQVEVEIHWRST